MMRTCLSVALGVLLGAGGLTLAEHRPGKVAVLAKRDIVEKLDGKKAAATVVELTLAAGEGGAPHRHPGPVFGYVLEGEYELGIDDGPATRLKAGATFYEPTGCLHRVSRNPGKARTRVLAVVLHPRDAEQIVLPEPAKKE